MSLLRSAATISALTMLSRITGLVRDMLIARYFGAGAATDAFYVAFRIPNMLRRLFAEGAFSQAFVPMLSQVKATESEAGQHDFIDNVFSALAAAVFLTTVMGVIAAPVIVYCIASGFADAPDTFALATELTRWMFPYIIMMSLVAMGAAVLNTWKHFAVPAFTPVLLNVSFIACTLFCIDWFEKPVFALLKPTANWHLMRTVASAVEQGPFSLKAIGEAFDVSLDALAEPLLSQWISAGLLTKSGDLYSPTTAGRFWHVTMAQFLVSSLTKKLSKDASGLPAQAFESVYRPVEEADRSRSE